MVATVCGKK